MLVLGIETSCDETAAAIIRGGTEIVSGGTATSTTVNSGGVETVAAGGTTSGTTVSSERIALVRIPGRLGGPCPFPDQWSREVLVRDDGTLQVGGADDGSIIVPTP